MTFNPGFDIRPETDPLGFTYGEGVFGPEVEKRSLDSIRKSLLDPDCEGPDTVYAIAMDVGRSADREAMLQRNLLYGAVSYEKGLLGRETVRSQGHIHAVSPSCGMSTCEVYEIWTGAAYIYMQESGEDNPGRCCAVYGEPGDVIIVPPGWVHATITADPAQSLSFGAWCVRDYGFEYAAVRKHKGIAWFLTFEGEEGSFTANPNYGESRLIVKKPRIYTEFGLEENVPIYTQFIEDPDRFLFVPRPQDYMDQWTDFEP